MGETILEVEIASIFLLTWLVAKVLGVPRETGCGIVSIVDSQQESSRSKRLYDSILSILTILVALLVLIILRPCVSDERGR